MKPLGIIVPYFSELIEHIDQSWFKKKGMHYPFSGRDFKDLKSFSRSFGEWGLMSLWDIFMASKSEWVKKSGYSISAFIKCLPWLVDVEGWKEKSRQYQEKMVTPMGTEISNLLKQALKLEQI